MKDQSQTAPRFIPNDLIGQIENKQKIHAQGETKYDDLIISSISFAYEFVQNLRQSQSELKRFLTHPFWEGKNHEKADKQLPRLAMRFIVGAETTGGRLYEKARSYARVVEYYLSQDLSPANMQADLRETSLEEIYEKIKSGKPGAGNTSEQAPPRPGRRLTSTDGDQKITEQSDDTSNTDDSLDDIEDSDRDADPFSDNVSGADTTDKNADSSSYLFGTQH